MHLTPLALQWQWVAFTHDGSKVGDRQEVTVSIRMVRRGGGDTGSGPTMDISLGSVLTDSGTADGEVQALNDRMFLRYRHWMDLWLEVHVGSIYEPITMSQIPILRIVMLQMDKSHICIRENYFHFHMN